jgi:hypothetical protein
MKLVVGYFFRLINFLRINQSPTHLLSTRMEAEREKPTETIPTASVERKRRCLVQEQARLEAESIFLPSNQKCH